MNAPPPTPQVALNQVDRFEFIATYPGAAYPPLRVDEAAPTGTDRGPNPVRVLATAVGHCMSSTLVSTLERAHVATQPVRTRVRAEVGRNAKGRLRVLRIDVTVETSPLQAEDRERFDHCVAIFEDFCTVSGAVRVGIPIGVQVLPETENPAVPT